jgi:small conductance mechanosensitive channel
MSVPEVLRVDNLGDSGIDIKILGEVKPLEQWGVMGELRLRLKKAFDAEGIEIPWPHLKVYFGESQASTGLACKACSKVNLPGSKFCSHCGAKLRR